MTISGLFVALIAQKVCPLLCAYSYYRQHNDIWVVYCRLDMGVMIFLFGRWDFKKKTVALISNTFLCCWVSFLDIG